MYGCGGWADIHLKIRRIKAASAVSMFRLISFIITRCRLIPKVVFVDIFKIRKWSCLSQYCYNQFLIAAVNFDVFSINLIFSDVTWRFISVSTGWSQRKISVISRWMVKKHGVEKQKCCGKSRPKSASVLEILGKIVIKSDMKCGAVGKSWDKSLPKVLQSAMLSENPGANRDQKFHKVRCCRKTWENIRLITAEMTEYTDIMRKT